MASSKPFNIDIQPFLGWNSQNPTQSLQWYDNYNKTKHNKADNFSKAQLKYCLDAIAANIIMFCVKYSPYQIIDKNDSCSNLLNEFFTITLHTPDISSFYIPSVESVERYSGAFSGPLASNLENPWSIEPLIL